MTVKELRDALVGIDDDVSVCINHEKYGYCLVQWGHLTTDPRDQTLPTRLLYGLEGGSGGSQPNGSHFAGCRVSTGSY